MVLRLSSDSFLTELTKLFQAANSKQSGSVQITFKPFSPAADAAARSASKKSSSSKKKGASSAKSSDEMSDIESFNITLDDEPVCLLHARLHDTKISTIIPAKDVAKFHRSFSALLTVNCSESLLAKGETKESKKRKLVEASSSSSSSSMSSPKPSSAAASSKKKKEPKSKKAKTESSTEGSGETKMDVDTPAAAAAEKPKVLTRKEKQAIREANKKPPMTKQQRRQLRKQPNPHKEMEKKKTDAGSAASNKKPSKSNK